VSPVFTAHPAQTRVSVLHKLLLMIIREAVEADLPLILTLIRALAVYERLEHKVVATEEVLRESLFGARPYAETLIAEEDGEPFGFAIFFHNFSTFIG